GHVKFTAIGSNGHVPRTLPDDNGFGDLVAGDIDHADRAVGAVRYKNRFSVGMNLDAIRAHARRYHRHHLVARHIDGIHLVRQFARDVGKFAVGRKSDATRTFAHLDRGNHFARGNVDHIHHFGFFGAHVHPFTVPAEHGMFRVFAFGLNLKIALAGSGVDEMHGVVFL